MMMIDSSTDLTRLFSKVTVNIIKLVLYRRCCCKLR